MTGAADMSKRRIPKPAITRNRQAPCFSNMKLDMSRERRANQKDFNNMMLGENAVNNKGIFDPTNAAWHNNGFQGNVQYIPYFGRAEIRGGEKLVRDIQCPTFPKENMRNLNVTQMTEESAGKVQIRDFGREAAEAKAVRAYFDGKERAASVGADARESSSSSSDTGSALAKPPGHALYLESMREAQSMAKGNEFTDNPYVFDVWGKKRAEEAKFFGSGGPAAATGGGLRKSASTDGLLPVMAENVRSGYRPAGLGSINPTLGTNGKTQSFAGMAPDRVLETWRKSCTPWAIN